MITYTNLWIPAREAYRLIKSKAPYDTGNLRDHGITLEATGINEYTISIGAPEAPYAVYTNEVWVSPKWNGKKNPNEHWIDKAVTDAVMMIAAMVDGMIATHDGQDDRWLNRSYWDSPEGQAKIKEYGIDDIYSIVG